MDAVSDVLRVVRLDGAAYLNAEFTAPWCVLARRDTTLRSAFLPPSERVISYHLITGGACHARLADDPASAIELRAGELLVVPQGEDHIVGSGLELAPVLTGPLLAAQFESAPGHLMTLSHGGGGEATRMVCGFLACDETLSNPLLSALPRLFKVDLRGDPRLAWLDSLMQFAVLEAAESRGGSRAVLARLSELLFVEALRRCIDSLPEGRKDWLAGARDRFVGRALSLLHAQPAREWSVDELAGKVGLSRSALSQRFTDLVGQPPMQYLARWRLQLAAQEILKGGMPLRAVAAQAGYESAAAFNNAFKREFGLPPAGWRRRRAS